MDTYTITWDEMHRDARHLAEVLSNRSGHGFTHVIGIAKGGLIPATIIARELGIISIQVITAISYGVGSLEDEQRHGKVHIDPFSQSLAHGYPLVIDDLVDSGETLWAVKAALHHGEVSAVATYATLYCKGERRADAPLTYARWFPADCWLLMPWDTSPQFQSPLISQLAEPNQNPPRNIQDPS